MDLKVNESLRALIPPLSPEEYSLLEKSLIWEGCRDKLITWQGVIVDGHNRYEICKKHGIEFEVEEREFENIIDARVWMRNNALGQRNLTIAWKIELELENKKDLKQIGEEKSKQNLKQYKNTDVSPNDTSEKHNTREEIAKNAGTSTGNVGMAEQLIKKAPELWKKAKTGEIGISTAYKQVRKEEKKQEALIRKEKEDKLAKEIKIVESFDFVKNASILESKEFIPNNIKVLLTDPPYGQAFISNRREVSPKDEGIANDDNLELALDLLDKSLEIISDKMADNSFAFVFTSWKYEPEFRAVFEKYFKIKNSLIWVKRNHGSGDLTGSFAPKHERILFGVKGSPKLNYRISDVLEGSQIITTHPTSKPIDLLQELIKVSSDQGDIIFDPFAGHGSTLLSALKLKRKAYGTELDDSNFNYIIKNIKSKLNG